MEGRNHTEVVFAQYLHENGENICPDQGSISYVGGRIQCSVHHRVGEDGSNDDEDGSVRFL